MWQKLIDCLMFSGINVTISLNPFQWKLIPKFYFEEDWYYVKNYRCIFLFLTFHFWYDAGE
jgi:hypothetical protein